MICIICQSDEMHCLSGFYLKLPKFTFKDDTLRKLSDFISKLKLNRDVEEADTVCAAICGIAG